MTFIRLAFGLVDRHCLTAQPVRWVERVLLVDYENIQAAELQALPDDVNVRFVLGGKQGSLPTALASGAQSMGSRFGYVRILSVERNACDFCIAYYLGEYLQANPRAEFVILSKDKKGFDPLDSDRSVHIMYSWVVLTAPALREVTNDQSATDKALPRVKVHMNR